MDKKTEKLLGTLLNLCEDENKYIVVKPSDFIDPRNNTEEETERILNGIKYFIDAEYINCKYFDQKNICFAKLPKGSLWLNDKSQTEQVNKKNYLLVAVVFCAGFAGAFAGALLANLLF